MMSVFGTAAGAHNPADTELCWGTLPTGAEPLTSSRGWALGIGTEAIALNGHISWGLSRPENDDLISGGRVADIPAKQSPSEIAEHVVAAGTAGTTIAQCGIPEQDFS